MASTCYNSAPSTSGTSTETLPILYYNSGSHSCDTSFEISGEAGVPISQDNMALAAAAFLTASWQAQSQTWAALTKLLRGPENPQ